jgi:hypothetical protein
MDTGILNLKQAVGLGLFGGGWKLDEKFGKNPSVTTTIEDIWDYGGTRTDQSAAKTLALSSADTDDDAAGTGARTVQIWGVDGSYNFQTEVVTMDGTTQVDTVYQYLFIYRMKCLTFGSQGVNDGAIYAYDTSDTNGTPGVPDTATKVFAMINDTKVQTLMACFMMPVDYEGYVIKHYFDYGSTAAKFLADAELCLKEFGEGYAVKNSIGALLMEKEDMLYVPPKSIVKLRASASAATAIYGGFDLIYRKVA